MKNKYLNGIKEIIKYIFQVTAFEISISGWSTCQTTSARRAVGEEFLRQRKRILIVCENRLDIEGRMRSASESRGNTTRVVMIYFIKL